MPLRASSKVLEDQISGNLPGAGTGGGENVHLSQGEELGSHPQSSGRTKRVLEARCGGGRDS